MKAIVLTSTMRRHRFVANALAGRLDVAGVWQEEKSFQPMQYAESEEDEIVIRRHFAERDAAEETCFADHTDVRASARRLRPGGCNDPAEIDAMCRVEPDIVLVFGTSLLQQPLLDRFPGKIINLHLGLSPYYRGAGTNFWPLVNGEPEYCGATIHFLDIGVDTGPILAHVRPEIVSGDGAHDIGNKTIVSAAAVLAEAAAAYVRSPLRGQPQSRGGRVYRRADFSAAAVRQLNANVEHGMIRDYVRDKARRDAALSLVALPSAALGAGPSTGLRAGEVKAR